MSEREVALSSERKRKKEVVEIIFMFSGFTAAIGALSLRKLRGFLLYRFPKENSLCILYLVFIVVHVILSVKDPKIMLA